MLETLIEESAAARAAEGLVREFAAESPAISAYLDPAGPRAWLTAGVHLDHLHSGNAGSVEKLRCAGVTSWTLAVYCESPEQAIREAERTAGCTAARDGGFVGFYLEGPFLGGANEPAAGADEVGRMLGQMPAGVAALVFAPEAVESPDFVKASVRAGVTPIVGYTESSYGDCIEAFDAGAAGLCLPFISTPPFHHRSPGPIGAAFQSGACAEIAIGAPGLTRPRARIIAEAFKGSTRAVYHPGMHPEPMEDGFPEDFCARAAGWTGTAPREFLLQAAARPGAGGFVIFDEELRVAVVVHAGQIQFGREGA